MKKFLICLMCLICLSAFTVSAAVVEYGMCGENVTWKLDDSGTLTIGGTGPMKDYSRAFMHISNYTFSTAPWSEYGNISTTAGTPIKYASDDSGIKNERIKKVVIEEGVTKIGVGAFRYCTKLEEVIIADSVTEIGGDAFDGCISLKELHIPKNVTTIKLADPVTFGGQLFYSRNSFYGCENLNKITVAEGNKHFIVDGEWFYNVNEPSVRFLLNKNGNSSDTSDYKTNYEDNDKITVYCNKEKVIFDTEPIIKNGRTLVPVRAIAEALGADVFWEPALQRIVITKDWVDSQGVEGTLKIVMHIGETTFKVDYPEFEMDVPPEIINDRTYVPVRVVGEALNCKVEWEAATRTVNVFSKNLLSF